MASAAEQLQQNFNLSSFAKATELKQRIWFTLGALVVYRIGTYIPLPGIDADAYAQTFKNFSVGIGGMINMFSGGAIENMAIFALNIMPYISASIIMQLMTAVIPHLEQLKKEGEQGRKTINQYTRYGTVVLALIQAFGIAISLENSTSNVVIDPGWTFRITSMIILASGTVFLMWLGEQITARGVGNGISLIIFSGIVAGMPAALASTFELGRQGQIPALGMIGVIIGVVFLIAFIVYIERSQRRLIIQYPKRQQGNKMMGGDKSHLPLKLNTAGVIPPIFASSLLLLPATLVGIFGTTDAPGWVTLITTTLGPGQPGYMLFYAAMIIFFCFFYTAIVFNPADTADNLKKYGGFIPGIRPGERTAEYIDFVLTRLTVIGAAYLTFVCLIPELIRSGAIVSWGSSIPFYIGGTSILIVVTVTMDTVAQVQSHLLAHQYEGLIKKSKLRGSRR